MKKFINLLTKPLFVVSIGIAMTVGSAIISSYFLEKNNLISEKLEKESIAIDQSIDNYWGYVENFERKIDLAIISISGSKNLNNERIAQQYFHNWIHNIISSTGLSSDKLDSLLDNKKFNNKSPKQKILQYIELIKDFKTKSVSKIDDLYIEKISIQEQKNRILERNMLLKNTALLLQILGLILVLSKNIFI